MAAVITEFQTNAGEWYARYTTPDPTTELQVRLAGWAVTTTGEIVGVDLFPDGTWEDARISRPGFIGFARDDWWVRSATVRDDQKQPGVTVASP